MGQPHFSILGFPVRIDTSALLIGAFIGLRLGSDAFMILGVFFFSILLHELGHALAFRRYGCSSFITIHGMGGTTASFDAQRLTDRQHIFVSLAGPLSQLILLGFPAIVASYYYGPFGQFGWFLNNMIFINVGWALVNLLPIYPLDGGQVLHRLLRDRNVTDPWKISQIVTVAVGIPLALLAYQLGYTIGALLIGYMVLRGVMSRPGGGNNSINDAASRARADHKKNDLKRASRDDVLREAYDCLLNGNSNRLSTLTIQLDQGKHYADLNTLQAWQAALYGPIPDRSQVAVPQSDSVPSSDSVILQATKMALANPPSPAGTANADSGIGVVLQQSLGSPELLAAVVTLAKHGQLEQALAATTDDGVVAIREALVKGGLPQEQMAVSRILRLRREAAAEG